MAQHIRVVAYQADWEEAYQREKKVWETILGSELLQIYHIGSTAVPGLWSKPIIDMMPVVKRIDRVDVFQPEIEAAGYECMGEFGIPKRRYFRKGGDQRTHQVHVFDAENQADIIRHLAVRDYLRTHEEVREAYGSLKRKLAERFPNSIEDYCDGKDAFVKKMEQDALSWYASEGSKENG